MSIKDPKEFRGSSFQLRNEKHEAMRQLLERTGLASPAQLILALVNDIDAAVNVVKPLAQKYHDAQKNTVTPAEQRRKLAEKLKTMTPEALAKLMALVD